MYIINVDNYKNYESHLGVKFRWPQHESKNYDPEEDNIIIGDNVIIRSPCIIYWGCIIGNNSQICHNVILREHTVIGRRSVIGSGVCTEGYTKIGEYVTIETQCHITGKMTIEDNVFMGPNCTTTNTKTIVHGRKNLKLIEKGPTIKFGARIGGGVTICPDLVIGREALIGAGAVVTKDIPDFKIAVGIPAKVIGDVPEGERY